MTLRAVQRTCAFRPFSRRSDPCVGPFRFFSFWARGEGRRELPPPFPRAPKPKNGSGPTPGQTVQRAVETHQFVAQLVTHDDDDDDDEYNTFDDDDDDDDDDADAGDDDDDER